MKSLRQEVWINPERSVDHEVEGCMAGIVNFVVSIRVWQRVNDVTGTLYRFVRHDMEFHPQDPNLL